MGEEVDEGGGGIECVEMCCRKKGELLHIF